MDNLLKTDQRDWNERTPAGTVIVVRRVDGGLRLARTAGPARLVGQFWMVPIEPNGSLWLLQDARHAGDGDAELPWLGQAAGNSSS